MLTIMARPACAWVLAVLLVNASLARGTDDDAAAAKAELARHQGVWVATSSTFDGAKAPEAIARSIRRTVTDDHVTWDRDGKRFAGTSIKLDPSHDPKAIDVIPDGGPHRGEPVLGIYKLDGDHLTICMAGAGKPRPTKLAAEKGSGCTLQTLNACPFAKINK